MRVFGNVVRGITAKFSKGHKPSIGEVYKAGRLLGLDEEDISSLVQESSRPSVKGFLRRHWCLFLPIAIVITVFAIVLVCHHIYWSTYPRGATYDVIGTKDIIRKHLSQ